MAEGEIGKRGHRPLLVSHRRHRQQGFFPWPKATRPLLHLTALELEYAPHRAFVAVQHVCHNATTEWRIRIDHCFNRAVKVLQYFGRSLHRLVAHRAAWDCKPLAMLADRDVNSIVLKVRPAGPRTGAGIIAAAGAGSGYEYRCIASSATVPLGSALRIGRVGATGRATASIPHPSRMRVTRGRPAIGRSS